jgi:hypothetical protein
MTAIARFRNVYGDRSVASLLELIRPFREAVQSSARRGFLRTYESAASWIDRHWADLETEHPNHPQPILFVVATFSMAVGAPLYEAAKLRDDDSMFLSTLEEVVTDADYVRQVEAAVQQAPLLSPVARRHLLTGFEWMAGRQYVDAYPPFYNGLESALKATARDRGVVDAAGRLVSSGRRVSKIDDTFADLFAGDPKFRRFLSAWIFGDRGNPFRHGDIDDPVECRRQSLRLAAAVIGWLEIYGGWSASDFRARLEERVAALLLPPGKEVG